MNAAALCLGDEVAQGFMAADAIDALYKETYLDVHGRYCEATPGVSDLGS